MKDINPDIVAFDELATNELRKIASKGLSNVDIIQLLATLESLKMNFIIQINVRAIKEQVV